MKRKHEKIQLSVSKDSVQSQSIASSDGCLSLLKKRRIDGKIPVIGRVPLSIFSPHSGNYYYALPFVYQCSVYCSHVMSWQCLAGRC